MSNQHNNSRRDFLKTAALAGLGIGFAGMTSACASNSDPVFNAVQSQTKDLSLTRRRPKGQKPVHSLTTTPIEKVRVGLIGLGQRGGSLINDLLNIPFVEVTAICDIREDRVANALKKAEAKGQKPMTYSDGDRAWEKLVQQDNIDVVYVASPWNWHCEMCVKSMEAGKHAFVEVAAVVTIDECWKIVDTSEKTQRHCSILENCCYGRNELFVLNMAREGVFGELTHAECAYIHDLRSMLFYLGTEGDWRREYHKVLDGNLYPTHGLGPVCQYMDIGRGDQMKYLVSMSSPEAGLSKWLKDKNPNDGRHAGEKYICGDMNTSLIKTELGRSIMIQHDVISPRPYSRINALSGTGGTFFDYPARLALDDPKKYGLNAKSSHGWLKDDDLETMRQKYDHPLYKQLQERAKTSGHGGMDYVMSYRLLDCIRQGITPDTTVYDAALWSCIIELSAKSVKDGSMPVAIPDFTRGDWKTIKPLGIVTA
ncbi:MAG: Gfo/Idh/MocA family oxidoreductase [Puniceicoccales bacterium]|nr:Gfo/Idh/MocA family oxidoreductase [Puniceicoccales bacterium]